MQKGNSGYGSIASGELCRNLCCRSADARRVPRESQGSGSRRTPSGQILNDTLHVPLADKKQQGFHWFEKLPVLFADSILSFILLDLFSVFICKHALRKSQKQ